MKFSAPFLSLKLVLSLTLALMLSLASVSAHADQRDSSSPVMIEYVLDFSGSMTRSIKGGVQAQAALRVLQQVMPNTSYPVALRVFGHRVDQGNQERSCTDSELVLPFARYDSETIAAALSRLKPRGYTPLSFALSAVGQDFSTVKLGATRVRRVVVLLSDGFDSCGGSPAASVQRLQQQGISVTVHAIAFNPDSKTVGELRDLVAAGSGGSFAAISSVDELQLAMQEAVATAIDPLRPRATATPSSRPRRGDLGGRRDAGEVVGGALPLALSQEQFGYIGAPDQLGVDSVDWYTFPCREGEKFAVEISVTEEARRALPTKLESVALSAEVVTGTQEQLAIVRGAVAAEAAPLITDVFRIPQTPSCHLKVALTGEAPQPLRYRVFVRAMVGF